MKVLLLCVLASLASGDWNLKDCKHFMGVVESASTYAGGVKEQVDILLAEVCPKMEYPEKCVAELPAFWTKLAPIMWSFAYSSERWCGDLSTPEVAQRPNFVQNLGEVTCDECVEASHRVFVEFAKPETVQWLVDYMVGPPFCGSSEEVEKCKKSISTIIPLGMPYLLVGDNPEEEKLFCKYALDVC